MKNKTMAMTGALLIGGLLTFNSVAFADIASANSTKLPQKFTQVREKIQGKMGDARYTGQRAMKVNIHQDWSAQLKELVTAGTITQATADKIQTYIDEQQTAMKADMEKLQAMTSEERKAYFESNKTEAPQKLDLFSSMIEKGIITQTEAAAIKEKVKVNQKSPRMMHKEKSGKDWSIPLKDLIAAGTITQATADKIQAYTAEQQAASKAEMEKVKAMTEDERKAYFESKKSDTPKKQELFSTLAEKGILTQSEVDAIKASQQANQKERSIKQGAAQQENRTTALNKLVENKIITAEQAAKINEVIAKEQANREAEMEKIKAMTQEERTAYLKSNMLTQLVTDNVLTQEQADAVEKVLHSKGYSKGLEKGFGKGMNRK